jgi:thiol-disulfide isomerase/thioredoxin
MRLIFLHINVTLMLCVLSFGLGKDVFAQLQQAKPWLGVAIDQGKNGVLVKDVLKGTPAEQYGLKAGDEITAINKLKVAVPQELIKAVQASGVGNTVVVHYMRGGKAREQKVQLVAKPDELELLKQQLVGKPAPDFSLQTVDGHAPAQLKVLKGQNVVIEFWATWCPACVASHKRLSEFAAANSGKVHVLAVSDEEHATIAGYLKGKNFAFTTVRDGDQKMQGAYKVSAIPQFIMIDKSGTVVDATIGGGTYLEEFLTAAQKRL